ncbi:unnamed protein product [Meganyctiphanes norvegica]|uniref:CHK kinase-like domain-containing protein n=1 Tax=Meganyctiphanes norvegica TaxID=48144 RepID=A0AAV2QKY9_MEGNR
MSVYNINSHNLAICLCIVARMKSPRLRSDVSRKWVEYMLTQYESRSSPGSKIKVETFTIATVTSDGEGFTGDIIKLDVEASLSGIDSESIIKKYNLVVKLLSSNLSYQPIQNRIGINLRELTMYEEVVKDFNSFQSDHANNEYSLCLPKFVYGKCSEDEFVLVMENVKVHGFETISKCKGLDISHLQLLIRKLAYLHSVSYAYNKMHNFIEKYPCFVIDDKLKWYMNFGTPVFMDIIIQFLKSKNATEDLGKKIEIIKYHLLEKCNESFSDHNKSIVQCLNHGDPWTGNFLFKQKSSYGDDPIDDPLMMVDWQMTHWNSPAMDLQFLINTSTTSKMRTEHLENILYHYHSTFIESVNNMDVTVSDWSYDCFKEEYDRLSYFGLVRGLINILICLSNHGANYQKVQSNQSSMFFIVLQNMQSFFTKMLCPFIFTKTGTDLIHLLVKNAFAPLLDELVSGKNKILNERILEILNEADANGLFNKLLINVNK